jgi:hypothetical protein
MKFLRIKLLSFTFTFLLIFSNYFKIVSTENISIKLTQQINTTQRNKFLFMLKWPTIKHIANHPLNVLSYKNVLLSNSQFVFFVSQNPLSSVSIIYYIFHINFSRPQMTYGIHLTIYTQLDMNMWTYLV